MVQSVSECRILKHEFLAHPITGHTFEGCLLAVSSPTSGTTGFRGVTGGVYKARERIHRGIADPRLLAIPRSRSRVADSDPN